MQITNPKILVRISEEEKRTEEFFKLYFSKKKPGKFLAGLTL